MPRLRHYDNLGTARAVTFTCYHRQKLLTDNEDKSVFMGVLQQICEHYRIEMLGYVLMPDHVHLVLHPPEGIKLGPIIGKLKSLSAKAILKRWRQIDDCRLDLVIVQKADGPCFSFWQKRCYDHNCRTIDVVRGKIEYCHRNPVRAGLVKESSEWYYSSFRWYAGLADSVYDV
jgi:putative transposase